MFLEREAVGREVDDLAAEAFEEWFVAGEVGEGEGAAPVFNCFLYRGLELAIPLASVIACGCS